MKRLRELVRELKVGDWIAALVVFALSAFVLWFTAGNLWNMAVSSLQPPLLDDNDLTRIDVIAQRSMAAAAWWMVMISGVSAIVSGFGLYLIAHTLKEARRSADAAERAVKASQKAVKTARKMGEAQVRAYVMVANAELHWAGNDEWELRAQIVNSGQTPAFKVWVEATVVLEDDEGNQQTVEEIDVSLHDLPANSNAFAQFVLRKLEPALKQMRGRGEPFLEVLISVCYDTIFDEGELNEAPYYGTQDGFRSPFELTRDFSEEVSEEE